MKNGIFCLMALFVWQACSVEDKGNYEYNPLNGVTVTFAKEEENQIVEKGVGYVKKFLRPLRAISTEKTKKTTNTPGSFVPGKTMNIRWLATKRIWNGRHLSNRAIIHFICKWTIKVPVCNG